MPLTMAAREETWTMLLRGSYRTEESIQRRIILTQE
uniref:Uncharacterized protein n=1 Tax=Picea sitchensis TaxID=3332 RepID=A9NVY0_PICSI|nr:unknown [Picea sitchensis]